MHDVLVCGCLDKRWLVRSSVAAYIYAEAVGEAVSCRRLRIAFSFAGSAGYRLGGIRRLKKNGETWLVSCLRAAQLFCADRLLCMTGRLVTRSCEYAALAE